jgi:hypothetical protein
LLGQHRRALGRRHTGLYGTATFLR